MILSSEVALSHQEILKNKDLQCNRVTVYRILDKLEEQGEIHKIIDTNGTAKFAKCSNCSKSKHMHKHLHFSCTACKEVTCLTQSVVTFEVPNDYMVENANFTLSGICPKCAK